MRLTVTATLSIVTFMAAHASTGRQAQAQPQDAATMVSEVCSACHGPKGNSPESAYPRLAGQQKDYLEIQLKAFRDRARGGPMAQAYMWTQASRLSDGMIVKLAAYFAEQEPSNPGPPDSSVLQTGQTIYERGIPSARVVACTTCHGKQAQGDAVIPRLARQHPEYLVKQLVSFKNEIRADTNAAPMHAVTSGMTLQQIIAVAEWASHLGG
jgi:cytochrome c553